MRRTRSSRSVSRIMLSRNEIIGGCQGQAGDSYKVDSTKGWERGCRGNKGRETVEIDSNQGTETGHAESLCTRCLATGVAANVPLLFVFGRIQVDCCSLPPLSPCFSFQPCLVPTLSLNSLLLLPAGTILPRLQNIEESDPTVS